MLRLGLVFSLVCLGLLKTYGLVDATNSTDMPVTDMVMCTCPPNMQNQTAQTTDSPFQPCNCTLASTTSIN